MLSTKFQFIWKSGLRGVELKKVLFRLNFLVVHFFFFFIKMIKTSEQLSAICVKCFGYCVTNIISFRHY